MSLSYICNLVLYSLLYFYNLELCDFYTGSYFIEFITEY